MRKLVIQENSDAVFRIGFLQGVSANLYSSSTDRASFITSSVSIFAKKLRRNGRITRNSASGYWSTFRGFLKILYRNGMIKTNVNDFLEKIETEDTMKEALSVEELYLLAETPCKKPIVKIASLFFCVMICTHFPPAE